MLVSINFLLLILHGGVSVISEEAGVDLLWKYI